MIVAHSSQFMNQYWYSINQIPSNCLTFYLMPIFWSRILSRLLLLLSHFGHVQLCATPKTAAHQAPPSLGFSRKEHWSGLPFPSPMHESEKWKGSRSVVSNSSRPHGTQPTRLLCPWDFPGKNTGVGCHFLLQCMKGKREGEVTQSCPTLHDPMDCSLPGFSAHGISQARVLKCGAIAFSSLPRLLR